MLFKLFILFAVHSFIDGVTATAANCLNSLTNTRQMSYFFIHWQAKRDGRVNSRGADTAEYADELSDVDAVETDVI